MPRGYSDAVASYDNAMVLYDGSLVDDDGRPDMPQVTISYDGGRSDESQVLDSRPIVEHHRMAHGRKARW